jgi:hypothetical protein
MRSSKKMDSWKNGASADASAFKKAFEEDVQKNCLSPATALLGRLRPYGVGQEVSPHCATPSQLHVTEGRIAKAIAKRLGALESDVLEISERVGKFRTLPYEAIR